MQPWDDEFLQMWSTLDNDERFEFAIKSRNTEEFLQSEYLIALAFAWEDDIRQARARAAYKEVGGWARDLDRAVEACRKRLEPFMAHTERKRTKRIKARAIYDMILPPLEFIIPEILPAGCTLLAGKSKDGKSLMAYNIALAVAAGGIALGRYEVKKGRVWYLALEDGERRAQKRLREQMDQLQIPPGALQNLDITIWESQRIGAGLEDDIRDWALEDNNARLVIIDILEKVRAPRRQKGGISYEEDYEGTASLTRIAQDLNISILVVHHSNKTNPEDVRDSVSGTTGLMGGTDASWILRRNALESNATMAVLGREIETQELALRFEGGFWTVLGDAHTVNISDERKKVLTLLSENPQGLTGKDIAESLEKNYNTTRVLLKIMREQGDIMQLRRGIYGCPMFPND